MNCKEERKKNIKRAKEQEKMNKFMKDNEYIEVGPGLWKSIECVEYESWLRKR